MLTTVRDAQGHLLAACEWWMVDKFGNPSYAHGEYVWVNQLEVGTNGERTIQEIIKQIAEQQPNAVGAYWERRDKTGTVLHAFRRDQLVGEVSANAAV